MLLQSLIATLHNVSEKKETSGELFPAISSRMSDVVRCVLQRHSKGLVTASGSPSARVARRGEYLRFLWVIDENWMRPVPSLSLRAASHARDSFGYWAKISASTAVSFYDSLSNYLVLIYDFLLNYLVLIYDPSLNYTWLY